MVVAYDHAARSKQAAAEKIKAKLEAEKKRAVEQMKQVAAERDYFKRNSTDLNARLEAVEKKSGEEIAELKAIHERDLESAVASARRTAVADLQARMGRAYELFRKIMATPMENVVYLRQAEANIELLDDMEKTEPRFDPVKERDGLVRTQVDLKDADDVFDEVANELNDLLGKDNAALVNVGDIVASLPVEVIAESLGITAASGSNDGLYGLRLRGASEELNENQSAEPPRELTPERVLETGEEATSKAIVEAASSVQADPPREPVPPVQEPTTVEATRASSAGDEVPTGKEVEERGDAVA